VVIDTSVLVAIWRGEPSARRLHAAILRADTRLVSAVTLVEASLVFLGERGPGTDLELDVLARELHLEVVPVSVDQATHARDAARMFGRGPHPARLNFGDLFSYALASDRDEPLLFVGDDFAHTDVIVAEW